MLNPAILASSPHSTLTVASFSVLNIAPAFAGARPLALAQRNPFQPAIALPAGTRICPSACLQCSGTGEPWWCCPAYSRCTWDESGDPSCCPVGSVCWGTTPPRGPSLTPPRGPSPTTASKPTGSTGAADGAGGLTTGDDGTCYGCPIIEVAVGVAAPRLRQWHAMGLWPPVFVLIQCPVFWGGGCF